MMVEAQWRVLKHDFLLNLPRPRLDLLIWIITAQQLPLIRAKFMLKIVNRREALRWEKTFAKSWQTFTLIYQQEPLGEHLQTDQRYLPSLELWTCGCPSFITSKIMLCKHLVKRCNDNVRRTWNCFAAREVYIHRKAEAPYVQIEPVRTRDDKKKDFWLKRDMYIGSRVSLQIYHLIFACQSTIHRVNDSKYCSFRCCRFSN